MEIHLTHEQEEALNLLLADKVEYQEDGEIKPDLYGDILLQILRNRELKLPNVWVSVYRVINAYGGPEEGGWTYDHYELLSSTGHCSPYEASSNFNNEVSALWEHIGTELGQTSGLYITPEGVNQYYEGKVTAPHAYIQEGKSCTYLVTLELQRGAQRTWRKPIYC